MKTTLFFIIGLFMLSCSNKPLDTICFTSKQKIVEVVEDKECYVVIQEDSCFYSIKVTKPLAKALTKDSQYEIALERLREENFWLKWQLENFKIPKQNEKEYRVNDTLSIFVLE